MGEVRNAPDSRGGAKGSAPGSRGRKRAQEAAKMLEFAKKEEEQLEQQLWLRYSHLMETLRGEVRYYAYMMEEFLDLPPELSGKSWDHYTNEMMKDLDRQCQYSQDQIALEPLLTILNFRDRLMCSILLGALYQKAVLNQELGIPLASATPERNSQSGTTLPNLAGAAAGNSSSIAAANAANNHAASGTTTEVGPNAAASRSNPPGTISRVTEGHGSGIGVENPMLELQGYVRALHQKWKGVGLPDKYAMKELPKPGEPGFFSYSKVKAGVGGAPINSSQISSAKSAFQNNMLSFLREIDALDRKVRQMKFGKRVTISPGKSLPSEDLRKEIAKVFNKCSRLEHELQMSKAQQHATLDVQMEQNQRKIEEADKEIKKMQSRQFKLQSDLETIKVEGAALRREKVELAEKQQEMAAEHLPLLDKIDRDLAQLRGRVDELTADGEMLSQMFRLQVEESQKSTSDRDATAKELGQVNSTLRRERLKNQLKDVEIGKKETLYQRTIEARQNSLDDYGNGKNLIKEAEGRMHAKEAAWKLLKQEVDNGAAKLAAYQEDMRRATIELDELEQQKKECMKQFKAATGRAYAMLLEQYKVKPQTQESSSPRD
mmetsp:Transcript_20723/g.44194  ORF Transcript_20723/g.44194 Transcript_20723/m.44194 type:complete len:604 (-) Transcript_20723:270-2081(-)